MNVFHILVFQPVYNLVIFFADIFPGANFGLAIVSATLLIKLLFLSLSKKQIESQKQMQEIQPKIKQIQERFKDDKERQSKEIMSLYKDSGVNPFMGCLPMVIQIIFLIAIYRVILSISDTGFTPAPEELYGFIKNPGSLYKVFLFTDLAVPSIVFAVIAAAGQFYQTKMLMISNKTNNETKTDVKAGHKHKKNEEEKPKEADFAAMMNQQMLYLGPAMTLFIGLKFPAALSLYWLVSTVFAIIQQRFILKEKKANAETMNDVRKKSAQ
ncbi:MAG: YidC/Oxa1 family membrane protein insertase [Candidatus Moranbacteria bacterium]|nr:YidC/Oxa1 family membrane protein insertase [Candidatus Moranbacteria bacterium]